MVRRSRRLFRVRRCEDSPFHRAPPRGAVATAQGVGASLSGLAAGLIVDHFGYNLAFVVSAGVGFLALMLLGFALPETAGINGSVRIAKLLSPPSRRTCERLCVASAFASMAPLYARHPAARSIHDRRKTVPRSSRHLTHRRLVPISRQIPWPLERPSLSARPRRTLSRRRSLRGNTRWSLSKGRWMVAAFHHALDHGALQGAEGRKLPAHLRPNPVALLMSRCDDGRSQVTLGSHERIANRCP